MRKALRTLFWLAVIVLQVIAGQNPGDQVTFITTLTYLFLAGTAVLYAAVLARRASPRLLARAVPVVMFFPLAWEVIVDFRFATSCPGGLPLLDTRGAVRLVHPVRDLPALRAGN